MDLKQELTDYEIGGIGDIKKHTLRFIMVPLSRPNFKKLS